MDEDEKEALKEITDNLNRDVRLPPYDKSSKEGYSRQYQEYREQEMKQRELTRYEKLCNWASGILPLEADEGSKERLSSAIRLMDYEMSPGMAISGGIAVGLGGLMIWMFLMIINVGLTPPAPPSADNPPGAPIPISMMLLLGIFPFAAGYYTYKKPIYDAKNKVIKSSGEMILSILYMVVYMRSSPNLEGAIRFAGLNLEGPVADDLKGILWKVEVGEYSDVSTALHEYTKIWKDYNDDYLQSLQLIQAAMNDSNDQRRKDMLQDALDSILDGTRERMKHYAQNLKTPVMILNAMGAMLPVLGMILLPLISVFMGGVIRIIHLVMLFNLMLPLALWWFMQRLLSSRPPTASAQEIEGADMPSMKMIKLTGFGREFHLPRWAPGLVIFGIVAFYGILGYIAFPEFFPVQNEQLQDLNVPPFFENDNGGLNPINMLVRSVTITLGAGLGIGASLYLGAKERKAAQEQLTHIEQQFPRALFQLGNKISSGTPTEAALREAADATKEMDISGLFRKASHNVRDLGMTFEDALFDSTHGALREYPSKTIKTVMKAVLESSTKGTQVASMAMLTVSRYLQNIHQTQEELNDLLDDTTTTISMLAYLLGPVVSGVAVGMSQTIMTAMFRISSSYSQTAEQGPGLQGSASGLGALAPDGAIPPEALQFVVGIYLMQLLYILGTFYTKITEGENLAKRNAFTGKIMLVGITFYTVVLLLVGVIFGGMITEIGGQLA